MWCSMSNSYAQLFSCIGESRIPTQCVKLLRVLSYKSVSPRTPRILCISVSPRTLRLLGAGNLKVDFHRDSRSCCDFVSGISNSVLMHTDIHFAPYPNRISSVCLDIARGKTKNFFFLSRYCEEKRNSGYSQPPIKGETLRFGRRLE